VPEAANRRIGEALTGTVEQLNRFFKANRVGFFRETELNTWLDNSPMAALISWCRKRCESVQKVNLWAFDGGSS